MFRRRTLAVLSLLLTVFMLSGCLGIFKRQQTIDQFFVEVNSAFNSLDINKVFDLFYFGNVSEEFAEDIKVSIKYTHNTMFEILKLTKGTYSLEIVPSKDKDAIVENKNAAIINKGTSTFTFNFDPSLLDNVKLSDFSQAGQDWLEVEFERYGEPDQTLDEYLAKELALLKDFAEEEGLPFVYSVHFDYPMYHLTKVNKKWKFDGEKSYEAPKPT